MHRPRLTRPLLLAALLLPLPAWANGIDVLAGGNLELAGGCVDSIGDVNVFGANATLDFDEGGRLRLADGATVDIGNGALAGRLEASGAGNPPSISTLGAVGSDHFGLRVTSSGTIAVSALELTSLNSGGLSLDDGSNVDNGTPGGISGLVFDWIEDGGTYLRFLHTSGVFSVSDCSFGLGGGGTLFNISTVAGLGAGAVDATASNVGPRAGFRHENDHGDGVDNQAATSTITWFGAVQLLTIDGAVFSDGTPRLSFQGISGIGNDLNYHIEWDTDPEFSAPTLADSSVDMGFENLITVGDDPPFIPVEPVGYTLPALLDGTTYWWRVRCDDGSPSAWSEGVSFTYDSSRGPTDPALAHWYVTTTEQLERCARANARVSGGGVIIDDEAAGNGVITTPWITRADLHLGEASTFIRWNRIVVNVTHPDNATTIAIQPYDENGTAIGTPTMDSGVGTRDVEVSLAGNTTSRIYFTVTMTPGSTPRINSLSIEGDEGGTTAVTLNDLRATPHAGEVLVEWSTGAEVDNLGFNVYRSEFPERDFAQVNAGLVLGLGDSLVGGDYFVLDQNVTNGRTYYYLLEEVDTAGETVLHGPVSATPAAGEPPAAVDPSLYAGGQVLVGGTRAGQGVLADGSSSSSALVRDGGVRVVESSADGFLIEIDVPRFARTQIPVDGALRDLISIPGYHPSSELGRPVVPTRNLLIEIPPVTGVALEDLSLISESHGGYDLPANLPVPQPPPTSELGSIPSSHDGSQPWPPAALSVADILQAEDRTLLSLRVNPIGFVADSGTLVYQRRIQARLALGAPAPPALSAPGPAEQVQRALATSPGVLRFRVRAEGLYRIEQSELAAAGFDLSRDTRLLWAYVQGQPLALRLLDGGDGRLDPGDAIEFLARGNQTRYLDSTQTRYSDAASYWLAWGSTPGPRIGEEDVSPAGGAAPAGSYRALARYEPQQYVDVRPVSPAGKDHWYAAFLVGGGSFAQGSFDLSASGVAHPAQARLRYRLRGLTSVAADPLDHRVEIEFNGALVDQLQFDGYAEATAEVPVTGLREGANTVVLRVLGGATDGVYLDFLELSYARRPLAIASRSELRLRLPQEGLWEVGNLDAPQAELWDLSDPLRPLRLTGGQVDALSGIRAPDGSLRAGTSHRLRFDSSRALQRPGERELLVTTPAARRSVSELTLHAPTSDLHDTRRQADYLLVSARPLQAAAERLAAHRRARGLSVELVYVDEIWDEFAFGDLDPDAIPRFVRFAYEQWQLPRPRYLCLLGDGHYDYQDHQGYGSPNHVPPVMVETEFSWTACDNRLATVAGGDVLPDLRVGRLAANDLAQAQGLVDKVIHYETQAFSPAWGERHLFVADDEDGVFDFARSCAQLAERLPGQDRVVEAFHGTGASADDLRRRFEGALNGEGALFTVYAGHGNLTQWGNEGLVRSFPSNDVAALHNEELTIGLVLNCLSGTYAHPFGAFTPMGEAWMNQPGGGAVAFWASTGMTHPLPQDLLARHLFQLIFSEQVGVLGDAIATAKLRLAGDGHFPDVIDTWTLQGDPALSIAAKVPQLAAPNPLPPPPPDEPVIVSQPPGPADVEPGEDPPAPPSVAPEAPAPPPAPRRRRDACALHAPADAGLPAGLLPLALLLLLLAGPCRRARS